MTPSTATEATDDEYAADDAYAPWDRQHVPDDSNAAGDLRIDRVLDAREAVARDAYGRDDDAAIGVSVRRVVRDVVAEGRTPPPTRIVTDEPLALVGSGPDATPVGDRSPFMPPIDWRHYVAVIGIVVAFAAAYALVAAVAHR